MQIKTNEQIKQKKIFILPLFLSFIISTLFVSYSQKSQNRSKKEVANDYKKNYLASEIKDLNWNGSFDLCLPGKINPEAYKKVVQRVNYFRRMAGVPDLVKLNDSLNDKAQAAALLMGANNQLNHFPTEAMKCYSLKGFNGANTSNLSLDTPYSLIISDQIEEPGKENTACGHRAWILKCATKIMGFGATGWSYALCSVNTTKYHQPVPLYYSWPPKGNVPFQIVYKKWSFYIPNGEVNFTNTKVEIRIDSTLMKCQVLSRNNSYSGFGDPSISWNVNALKDDCDYNRTMRLFQEVTIEEKKKFFFREHILDKKIKVKISGVKVNNKIKDFEYEIEIFDPLEIK